jgi:Domain of unknown function (DUF5671)
MATARRLYLYTVSAVGLGLMVAAAISMLRLLVNKLGVGPQSLTSADADHDILSVSIAVGVVGLVVWLIHWAIVERSVRGWDLPAAPGDPAAAGEPANPRAAERRSIVRSVFFAAVMWMSLVYAADVVIDLLGRVIADMLGATTSLAGLLSMSGLSTLSLLGIGDDWELSIAVVLIAVWAYHAWIRGRDVRQGPAIKGAAAWVSRFYLYYAAFSGVIGAIGAVSSMVNTAGGQLAGAYSVSISGFSISIPSPNTNGGSAVWVRPLVAALVSLVVWGAIWLSHWLYSNRLRAGSTEQSADERASRVRLAFLIGVVAWGSATVVLAVGSGLGQLFEWMLGLTSTLPLWYVVVLPPLSAVPAAIAWFLHRGRALGEAAGHGEGISPRRIAGYTVALVGLVAWASGAAEALATIFGQLFAPAVSGFEVANDGWKFQVAAGAAFVLVGAVVWFWPWLCAENRRSPHAPDRLAEIRASSRAYYLYVIAGVSVVVLAGSLATILYRYLRVGFGLPETALGSEVSGALAMLLVAGALLAAHGLILRSDRPRPASPVVPTSLPGAPIEPGPAPASAPDAPAVAPSAPQEAGATEPAGPSAADS